MKTVAIYRTDLLRTSETFILGQAAATKCYAPVFVGLRRVHPSLPLPRGVVVLTAAPKIISYSLTRFYRMTGIAPRFHRAVRRLRPQLIHAHFARDGDLARQVASGLGVPLIVTLHGYDVTVRTSFQRRYARLWEEASLFLCVSEFIRDKAIEAGFPPEKLRVHYIGVDVNKFRATFAGRAEGLILFVGRLVEKKGCTHLLHAMQRVQIEFPDAELVIIGEGPLRVALEKQANSTGINAQFVGRQSSDVVRDYLTRATILCAPSVTGDDGDTEGLPIAILEALAAGVPVVSTFHAGIPEAVQHGENGLLAPERDHDALAGHLLTLLRNKELRSLYGRRGVERLRSHFDLDTQTALLEEIYDDVLHK